MKTSKRDWIVGMIALAVGTLAGAAEVQDLRRLPAVLGDAQAGAPKAATCVACHGPEGHSLVGQFPALAGQNATYLHLQLEMFKSGARKSEVMAPFIAPLTEADLRDLSSYFAAQAAKPATAGATPEDTGRRLYTQGDPQKGIPACQGCHGANGAGVKPTDPRDRVPWHSFPTLAGQQGDYVALQLVAFKDGTRGGTTHAVLMQAVAKNMDDAAIKAVAAYISSGLPAQ